MSLLIVGLLVFAAASLDAADLCDYKRAYDAPPAIAESGIGSFRLQGDPLNFQSLGAFRPARRLLTKEILNPAAISVPVINKSEVYPLTDQTVAGLLLQLQKTSQIPSSKDLILSKYYDILSRPVHTPLVYMGVNRLQGDLEPQFAGSGAAYHSKFSVSDVVNNFQLKNNNFLPYDKMYRINPYSTWSSGGKPFAKYGIAENRPSELSLSYNEPGKEILTKDVSFTWPLTKNKKNSSMSESIKKFPETQVLETQKLTLPSRVAVEHNIEPVRITTPPIDVWRISTQSFRPETVQTYIHHSNAHLAETRSPNSEQVTIKITWTSNSSLSNQPNSSMNVPYMHSTESPTTRTFYTTQPWNARKPTPAAGHHPQPGGSNPFMTPSTAGTAPPYHHTVRADEGNKEATADFGLTTEGYESFPSSTSQVSIDKAIGSRTSLAKSSKKSNSSIPSPRKSSKERFVMNDDESALRDDDLTDGLIKTEEDSHFRAPSNSNAFMLSQKLPKEQYVDAFFKSLNINNASKVKQGILQSVASPKDDDSAWSYREPNQGVKSEGISKFVSKPENNDHFMSQFARRPLPEFNPKLNSISVHQETSSVAFHHPIPINQLLSVRKKNGWGTGSEVERNPEDLKERSENVFGGNRTYDINSFHLTNSRGDRDQLPWNQPQLIHRSLSLHSKAPISLAKYKKEYNATGVGRKSMFAEDEGLKQSLVKRSEGRHSVHRSRRAVESEEDKENQYFEENVYSKLSPSAAGLMYLGSSEASTKIELDVTPSAAEIASKLETSRPFDHIIMQINDQDKLETKPRLQVIHRGPGDSSEAATLYPLYPVHPVVPINSVVLTSTTTA